MVAAEREIMFNLTTQYKLGVLQWFIVEQPVQFCPLCRGVAVLVLNGNARELLRIRHFRQCARKNKGNFGKKREGWTVPALLTRKNTRLFIIIKL